VKLVVIGLTLSSSWGNGHATTYRALLQAFARRGHDVLFLERDTPWYAAHRDLPEPGFCRFALYDDLAGLDAGWRKAVAEADAVMVGSFTPEGVEVGRWAQTHAHGLVVFYDIDTPVTLARLAAGDADYVSAEVIPGYDLYLSFTGGQTLATLEQRYGAPAARALYCSVDAEVYRPLDVPQRWDLSYLGTYSPDRQPILDSLKTSAGPPTSSGWSMSRLPGIPPSMPPAASP
jgi:spore maturation protein CgeB